MTGKRFTLVDDYLIEYDGDCFDLHKPSDIRSLITVIGYITDENEQLKEQIADLENSFDICKHYKETYGDEIVHIKHTIKTMMETERTELGRSVLRQLWEAIQ